MTTAGQFRQGDVLLLAAADIPHDLVALARAGGELVLADGEATGHRHAILEPEAELFHRSGAPDERYLRVAGAGATLRHQEHDPITLPPGDYRVIRQREYSPAAARYVSD